MIRGHGDDAYRFERSIRSNFSSNVYGHVDLEALTSHLRERIDVIGRYPEPEPGALERALAGLHGIDPAAVCVTSGATEAIYLTAHAFAGGHAAILQPTFSEYADACRMYGHAVHSISGHFLADEAESGTANGATVWLCNPNNPTGSVIPKDRLKKAIEKNPSTVFVIDQSYGFFTREPLLTPDEAISCPNVIQIHSMTKRYAIPGIRLGYVTACPELLARIRDVRMPWSVNALAIEAGLFLCRHPETAPIDLPALLAETQRLRSALNALPGLIAEPTQTHFFLCRMTKESAADLKKRLADRHGILIRDASNFEGLDAGCFRIATQAPEENDRLVEAIRLYLEERR